MATITITTRKANTTETVSQQVRNQVEGEAFVNGYVAGAMEHGVTGGKFATWKDVVIYFADGSVTSLIYTR